MYFICDWGKALSERAPYLVGSVFVGEHDGDGWGGVVEIDLLHLCHTFSVARVRQARAQISEYSRCGLLIRNGGRP